MAHLDANTLHVLGAATIDLAIHEGSLKSRLGPEAFSGGHHVRVAAEEQGGQGGLHAHPVHHLGIYSGAIFSAGFMIFLAYCVTGSDKTTLPPPPHRSGTSTSRP